MSGFPTTNSTPMSHRGFSLLETMLIMALIGIVLAVGLPIYLQLQTSNDLSIATSVVAQTLRLAMLKSQGVDSGTAWGTHLSPGSATIFRGTDFASRDQSNDETFTFSTAISFAGPLNFIFVPLTGAPLVASTLTLGAGDQTQTISITAGGVQLDSL